MYEASSQTYSGGSGYTLGSWRRSLDPRPSQMHRLGHGRPPAWPERLTEFHRPGDAERKKASDYFEVSSSSKTKILEGNHLGRYDLKSWDILGGASSTQGLLYNPASRHTTASTSRRVVEVRQGIIILSPTNQQQAVGGGLTKLLPYHLGVMVVSMNLTAYRAFGLSLNHHIVDSLSHIQ
jgi:hypothetical protein